MSDLRLRLVHAISAALASTLVAATLVALSGGSAEAAVPKAAGRYTAAIEPLASYQPQTTCSPAAKPGTVAFANLLLRTYPNSRSLGISRACNVGGVSEHKEGRAFDWGVSVNSKRDRASVNALMKWLLATDRYGNRYAMARRLGIQYMIWNHRIWGSYLASAGWRKYKGSNPHTDHVHFSLTWAGAREQTSFWHPRSFSNNQGSAPTPPKPKPSPKPSPKPRPKPTPAPTTGSHGSPNPSPDGGRRQPKAIPEPRAPRTLPQASPVTSEQVTVSTSRRAGTLTRKALVAGHRYLLEVSGTYHYARKAGSVADAECSTAPRSSWQRDRSLRPDQWYADHLDLYVDGHDLQAQADDGQSCDLPGHTYRWVYEAPRSGRVPFAVWDPNSYQDNGGSLSVRVLDLGAVRSSMSWKVPARSRAGATSPGVLEGGRDYRVTVSGTWRNGQGVTADAECALTSDGWRRDVDSYDMLVGSWSYDSLTPHVTGVRTLPVSGGTQCDPGHTYTWVQHADRTSPLNVRVTDTGSFADNAGVLTVRVEPYEGGGSSPSPAPSPSPSPSPSPVPTPPKLQPESFQVDSRSRTPVRTQQSFPAGTSLRITVKGMYFLRDASDWTVADAECTVTYRDWTWRPTRLDGLFNGTTTPLGDLAVNGGLVTWNPVQGRGSCATDDNHTYTYDVTTTQNGPLSFVVVDDDYSDNNGKLDVGVEMR